MYTKYSKGKGSYNLCLVFSALAQFVLPIFGLCYRNNCCAHIDLHYCFQITHDGSTRYRMRESTLLMFLQSVTLLLHFRPQSWHYQTKFILQSYENWTQKIVITSVRSTIDSEDLRKWLDTDSLKWFISTGCVKTASISVGNTSNRLHISRLKPVRRYVVWRDDYSNTTVHNKQENDAVLGCNMLHMWYAQSCLRQEFQQQYYAGWINLFLPLWYHRLYENYGSFSSLVNKNSSLTGRISCQLRNYDSYCTEYYPYRRIAFINLQWNGSKVCTQSHIGNNIHF